MISSTRRNGISATLDCHTAHVPCTVSIDSKMDRKGNVTESSPAQLKKGESGMITIVPQQPLCVEENANFPGLGRFGLRNGNKILAFGVVKAVQRVEKNPKVLWLTTELLSLCEWLYLCDPCICERRTCQCNRNYE